MTNQLLVKMVLDAWNAQTKNGDKIFDGLTEEQLKNEVAPNRNTGVYLLGHLAAVHDMMIPLLGLGERIYPQLDEAFIKNPDKSKPQHASVTDLKQYWKKVNETLANHFAAMKPDEWFQKHNSVSAEDFAKEPHRNKLNIIISRTNHLSYHIGQLTFL